MTVQLACIVKEKNDMVRRQTELEYLRRSHRLEVSFVLCFNINLPD